MNKKDRRLGMHRPIDRRDFLNGAGIQLVPHCYPLLLV